MLLQRENNFFYNNLRMKQNGNTLKDKDLSGFWWGGGLIGHSLLRIGILLNSGEAFLQQARRWGGHPQRPVCQVLHHER